MTSTARGSGRGIIAITFIVALLLTVLPMPNWIAPARPEWAALFVLFWCIALPERVGVGAAWTVGILMDVLRGTVLGQHALALAVVAFLTMRLHQRIRVYPLWQQALSILVLVTIYQLLILWTSGIIGKPAQSWTYWLPSLSSMLLWPVLFTVLNGVRRGFDVS